MRTNRGHILNCCASALQYGYLKWFKREWVDYRYWWRKWKGSK